MINETLLVDTQELKKARELKGFSIRDMSKFLGARSPATYYYIENGKVEPKIGQALRISKLFKKPVTNFFKLKVQQK
ncbi:MAG: helix-turn-helix transcriptional regulator [Clostridia bacterium]|nr:helix-turn-helix transcriptional regulator [Clostridia bacterium]